MADTLSAERLASQERSELTGLDKSVLACTAIMLMTSGYNLLASHGSDSASTLVMILATLSMAGIAVLHSLRHLGSAHALAYFGIIVVIELIFEQVNIWTGGSLVFGDLTYPDGFFGPKIFDVPIAVPLAMCAINWPSYVLVNVILFRRVVVTSRDLTPFSALIHCAILATVHTAWSFCAEPMALANEILYRPTIGDTSGATHWGVPLVEFRGWWTMTFLQFLLFSFVLARVFKLPDAKPLRPLIDSAPIIMYLGTAILLLSNPVNTALGVAVFFTMITYSLFALFNLLNPYGVLSSSE